MKYLSPILNRLLFCLILLTSLKTFSQPTNHLNPDYFGFEIDGWWKPADETFWILSTDKANSGDTSLYINCPDKRLVTAEPKIHTSTVKLNFPSGTKTVSFYIWKDINCESTSLKTTIKDPWKIITWDIENIETNTWVYLTKEISFDADVDDSNMFFSIPLNSLGNGVLFIDNFQIAAPETKRTSIIETNTEGLLSLDKGLYTVTSEVFIEEGTDIAAFYTQISEPWLSTTWDISTLTKNEWISITQEIEIKKDVKDAILQIQVLNDPDFGGGIGKFYIDAIHFSLKDELSADTTILNRHKIYPNPTKEYLFIESEKISSYTLFTISGIPVISNSQEKLKHQINVSELARGIYILKTISSGTTDTRKIIIQ